MIDIDNEEQILRMCDFDYFYESDKCSRELCMFYNDILKMELPFNKRQALIDLGRIGIILNQQAERIADLEAKLAESEEKINMLEEHKFYADNIIHAYADKCKNYEQQLSEKKTRIAELEDKDWYEATIKQLEEQNERLIKERDGNYENYSICWKDNEYLKQQLADKDNEKIKFAIAELEKVKEFFLEEHRDEEMDTDYIITKDAGQIADYLLDQIKLLKEGK